MLVNLAGADILFTVFFFAHFISSHHLSSPYEMPGNAICMVFRKLTWLGSYSSVFTMIVIARERYYTIVHPRGNKGKLTMHNLKVAVKPFRFRIWFKRIIKQTNFVMPLIKFAVTLFIIISLCASRRIRPSVTLLVTDNFLREN